MNTIKPKRLTLEAELKADIATLSDIARVKLATLRHYQGMIITLRRGNQPCPPHARWRLLFECRVERRAHQETLGTIAFDRQMLADLQREQERCA